MSTLLESVEVDFQTDFAIYSALDTLDAPVDRGTFATAGEGWVIASTGTKYSRVHAVAERWSAGPPAATGWEDTDELPFCATTGNLRIGGFDEFSDPLNLDGFGWGRVQVCARGRHRYHYSSWVDVDAMPPEEWLLRFFPVRGEPDPLAGPPRILGGAVDPRDEVRLLANDLQAAAHVVSDAGLTTTFERLAERLAARLEAVGAALTELVMSGRAHIEIASGRDTLAPDEPFVLRAQRPQGLLVLP